MSVFLASCASHLCICDLPLIYVPQWYLISFLTVWTIQCIKHFSPSGELRCYCNESGCVATGYMCKSSAGQCFTSLEIRGQVKHQTHGCLDSLSADHRRSCQDIRNNKIISSGRVGHLPLLLCCSEHMCNYRDDALLTPKHNGTYFRSKTFSRSPFFAPIFGLLSAFVAVVVMLF